MASRRSRAPKVLCFDLDGCVWKPEMYQLWGGGGAPFTVHRGGFVTDKQGTRVEMLGSIRSLLSDVVRSAAYENGELQIAFLSKSDEPAWARECLSKFTLDDDRTPLSDIATACEIYKGDKTKHFDAVRNATGAQYSEMMFFDNEKGNCDLIRNKLGVLSFCTDSHGVTRDLWDRAWNEYANRSDVTNG